ncbi:MAG: hypothetical protein AABN33_02480 [Acidobacteriota bacterium]
MTGTITYTNIVSRLLEAIPEFQPDREDVTDNLVYLVFGDLIRFAKRELEGQSSGELLQRVFTFLEEAARSQDLRVTEMLRDALHDLAIPDPDKAKSVMGSFYTQAIREGGEGSLRVSRGL